VESVPGKLFPSGQGSSETILFTVSAGIQRLYKEEMLIIRDPLIVPSDFWNLIDKLFGIDWVVYLKESFKNSDSVIKYLARHTHRIAISNHRIIGVENGEVLFSYKDYSDRNKKKISALEVNEFIQRFMNHVVPPRYVRIRYYGLMSNRNKTVNLNLAREYYQIPPKEKEEESPKSWDAICMSVTGCDPHLCPHCKVGEMITTSGFSLGFFIKKEFNEKSSRPLTAAPSVAPRIGALIS